MMKSATRDRARVEGSGLSRRRSGLDMSECRSTDHVWHPETTWGGAVVDVSLGRDKQKNDGRRKRITMEGEREKWVGRE